MSAGKRCAWLASAPSMEINLWTRLLDPDRVKPMFVQVGGTPIAANGVMSFSCAQDAVALADLLRALELDALIVSGIDVLPVVLAAARMSALPVLVSGATPSEDRTLMHLLPSQYADPRQRSHYIVPPDSGLEFSARKMERMRSQPRAKLRNRLSNRHDAWNDVAKAFPAFATPELRMLREQGYLLQPSGNIQRVPSHSYRITFANTQFCDCISLVPIVESPNSRGTLVVEMISPSGVAIRAEKPLHAMLALSQVDFCFPAMTFEAGSTWELRISVKNGEQVVRMLEMRRYRHAGWTVDLQPCAIFASS